MPLTLPKAQKADIIASLQRYASAELGCDLGNIQANHLLDYILKEIAPFAYNQGIEDAQAFLTAKVEDLPGTSFAEPLSYWHAPPPAPAKSAASLDWRDDTGLGLTVPGATWRMSEPHSPKFFTGAPVVIFQQGKDPIG